MTTFRIAPLVLAGSMALAFTLPAQATSPDTAGSSASTSQSAPSYAERRSGKEARHGEHRQRAEGHRHGRMQQHAHGPRHNARAAMRALELTDAQRDDIFALRHAAMPELRDAMKAAGSAQRELRAMAQSGEFNEARAEELAQASANARAQAMLTRTKLQADIHALLTPEQREKMAELRSEMREQGRKSMRSGKHHQRS